MHHFLQILQKTTVKIIHIVMKSRACLYTTVIWLGDCTVLIYWEYYGGKETNVLFANGQEFNIFSRFIISIPLLIDWNGKFIINNNDNVEYYIVIFIICNFNFRLLIICYIIWRNGIILFGCRASMIPPLSYKWKVFGINHPYYSWFITLFIPVYFNCLVSELHFFQVLYKYLWPVLFTVSIIPAFV